MKKKPFRMTQKEAQAVVDSIENALLRPSQGGPCPMCQHQFTQLRHCDTCPFTRFSGWPCHPDTARNRIRVGNKMLSEAGYEITEVDA